MGLFTRDFCPGDRGLEHQVSHHQNVNVPAILEEGEWGFQMNHALEHSSSANLQIPHHSS